MKNQKTLFKKLKIGKKSLIFIVAGIILLVVSAIIGISDNLSGIIVAISGLCSFFLAFVHHWTKPKNFIILCIVSIIGFFLFAVLHNLFYALAIMAKDIFLLKKTLEFLHVLSFLIAIFICPPGIITGLAGSIITALKNKKRKSVQL